MQMLLEILQHGGAARAEAYVQETLHPPPPPLDGDCRLPCVRSERETYRLGFWLARLGEVAVASVDLRAASRPYLRSLAARTGESAFLLLVQVTSAVVDVQETSSPLRLTLPVGTPWPLHAGASNRVLLAFLLPSQRKRSSASPLSGSRPARSSTPIASAGSSIGCGGEGSPTPSASTPRGSLLSPSLSSPRGGSQAGSRWPARRPPHPRSRAGSPPPPAGGCAGHRP